MLPTAAAPQPSSPPPLFDEQLAKIARERLKAGQSRSEVYASLLPQARSAERFAKIVARIPVLRGYRKTKVVLGILLALLGIFGTFPTTIYFLSNGLAANATGLTFFFSMQATNPFDYLRGGLAAIAAFLYGFLFRRAVARVRKDETGAYTFQESV